jgi:hypothetical protein
VDMEPEDTTTAAADDAARTPVSEAEVGTNDSSIWRRTTQGMGKIATTVGAAGSTVASKAASVGSGAASVAAAAGTAGVGMAASVASTAAAAGGTVVSKTGLGTAVGYLDSTLEQRGVKQAFGSAAGAVVDRLDQVTGKQLVELLEERLRMQDEYNDVLATKLAEALERIATLEEKLRNENP